ncbi:MAG: hypothetical protein J6D46_02895 [Lachnospiraceae bacterium]|nr:hypothetical protein [Lachnospiraceae bacterium]
MNKERRKRIKEAMEALDTAHDILIEIFDEEQEAFDNLPEGIQNGERGEQMNEYITSRHRDALRADRHARRHRQLPGRHRGGLK